MVINNSKRSNCDEENAFSDREVGFLSLREMEAAFHQAFS